MENIFEILKAILFGIVEGITEWLPISSTGHMILLNEFVKLDVSEEFWDMFLVVIQLMMWASKSVISLPCASLGTMDSRPKDFSRTVPSIWAEYRPVTTR